MKTAFYQNRQTGETHEISGVKNIGQAWGLAKHVALYMGWNIETFSIDVKVSLK